MIRRVPEDNGSIELFPTIKEWWNKRQGVVICVSSINAHLTQRSGNLIRPAKKKENGRTIDGMNRKTGSESKESKVVGDQWGIYSIPTYAC
jgi:hypothetical protein